MKEIPVASHWAGGVLAKRNDFAFWDGKAVGYAYIHQPAEHLYVGRCMSDTGRDVRTVLVWVSVLDFPGSALPELTVGALLGMPPDPRIIRFQSELNSGWKAWTEKLRKQGKHAGWAVDPQQPWAWDVSLGWDNLTFLNMEHVPNLFFRLSDTYQSSEVRHSTRNKDVGPDLLNQALDALQRNWQGAARYMVNFETSLAPDLLKQVSEISRMRPSAFLSAFTRYRYLEGAKAAWSIPDSGSVPKECVGTAICILKQQRVRVVFRHRNESGLLIDRLDLEVWPAGLVFPDFEKADKHLEHRLPRWLGLFSAEVFPQAGVVDWKYNLVGEPGSPKYRIGFVLTLDPDHIARLRDTGMRDGRITQLMLDDMRNHLTSIIF